MQILDGKTVSNARRELLIKKVAEFNQKHSRPPHLVVLLVGDDGASQVYVRNKEKACVQVGIRSTLVRLPSTLNQAGLNATIEKLNLDPGVDGILVQLPLPKGLDSEEVLRIIDPAKDSDVFSFKRLGELWAGASDLAPCTPQGVMNILDYYKINVEGMNVAVVGRSNIVGKPMAHLLSQKNATVTICHSKTKDLRSVLQNSELVVVAAGRKQFLGKDDFKKDSIVVDVGMHGSGEGGKVCGDVRFEELSGWVKAATPVPGGVGPMTITTLLENTLALAEMRLAKAGPK